MITKNVTKPLCFMLLTIILSVCPITTSSATDSVNYHQGLNNYVTLTIDDGYSREYIKQALDYLRSKYVKCTFFIIGSRLKAFPDLWKQAVKDGHEICYHSMNHSMMSSWSKDAIINDLRQWNRTAKSVLGDNYIIPKFARLPGGSGHHDARIQNIFASLGYRLIYWSSDTYTGVISRGTNNLNNRIAGYIKSTTHVNSIILTHFNSYDIPAQRYYIDWLKSHFKLGTISQAFARVPKPTPAVTPTISPIVVWAH